MLGDYRLQRKIAMGGMAEIWLAERERPDGRTETVVLKRILHHLARDKKFAEMFQDEARTAALLDHPNIVKVHELNANEGLPFISMEYVDGPDLDYIIDRAAQLQILIPQPFAVRMVADALAGLDYAHHFTDTQGRRLGLVHRDVSPHNVLVSRSSGEIKVCDFGVAKAATSRHKTQTGAIKGKFAYMSPEQIADKPLDGRSDIFSMGIVLYELTTNQRPFGDVSELLAVTAILTQQPADPNEFADDYPEELWRIIKRALAKNRDKRYPSAQAMRQDLEAYLYHRRLQVTPLDVAEFINDMLSPQPSFLDEPAPELRPRFEEDGRHAHPPYINQPHNSGETPPLSSAAIFAHQITQDPVITTPIPERQQPQATQVFSEDNLNEALTNIDASRPHVIVSQELARPVTDSDTLASDTLESRPTPLSTSDRNLVTTVMDPEDVPPPRVHPSLRNITAKRTPDTDAAAHSDDQDEANQPAQTGQGRAPQAAATHDDPDAPRPPDPDTPQTPAPTAQPPEDATARAEPPTQRKDDDKDDDSADPSPHSSPSGVRAGRVLAVAAVLGVLLLTIIGGAVLVHQFGADLLTTGPSQGDSPKGSGGQTDSSGKGDKDKERDPKENDKPKAKARGVLVVNSKPATDVFLKDKRLGKTPDKFKLPQGKHKIRLVNKDIGLDRTLRVTVEAPPEITTVYEVFKTGRLKLKFITDNFYTLIINGKVYKGDIRKSVELVEGEHLILIRNTTGQRIERTINIKANKSTKISVDI